jgi:hypothetical protein
VHPALLGVESTTSMSVRRYPMAFQIPGTPFVRLSAQAMQPFKPLSIIVAGDALPHSLNGYVAERKSTIEYDLLIGEDPRRVYITAPPTPATTFELILYVLEPERRWWQVFAPNLFPRWLRWFRRFCVPTPKYQAALIGDVETEEAA